MAEKKDFSRVLHIALAGNPNSGKTSIFNGLTGAHQRVGNYPGITVEKKEGYFQDCDCRINVIDLPGTYSLTSYSPEERIARNEILRKDIDVVVVIADSTNLDRNLYLLLQVMELGANTVLVLNMSDEARAGGQKLDIEQMKVLLGIPVVETVGHRGGGIKQLKQAIQDAVANPTHGERLIYNDDLEAALARIGDLLSPGLPADSPPVRWLAIKLLERDQPRIQWLRDNVGNAEDIIQLAEMEIAQLEKNSDENISLYLADTRYAIIAGFMREVRLSEMRRDARRRSEAVDSVLVHRVLGLPIFLLIMYVVFWLTFTAGGPPMGWIEAGFEHLAGWINGLWPAGSESALRSLLVDGIIGGVGGVLVFLPNIIFLFFGLALLEDTGYMARAAFLMDRFMHRFGLHGKSFVPMITGFGCTIPGIMATRTLENERDRLTTMLVLPLMSCGARLPIYLLIIPAFFIKKWQAPMLWLIYIIGIVLAVVLARVLRSTILAGEDAPFVMELPPYRMPTMRAVLMKMVERSWMYIRKAGTVILAISIVMWALTSYPKAPETDAQAEVQEAQALEYSLAGRLGKLIEPVTGTMGADYRVATAMIGAFAAKEVFVAQMGIVFSLGEVDEESTTLREKLKSNYTPLQGFAMILFLLIATPCMATVAVMRRETNSWRWPMLQFWGLTFLGWGLATLVYQIGRLLPM